MTTVQSSMPGSPGRRSARRGPTILIVVGCVTLLLGVVLGVVTVVVAARTMPFGVLGFDGRAGDDVLAVADAPGVVDVELEEDVEYSLLVVVATRASPASLSGPLEITGPDGSDVPVTSGSSMGFTVTGGDQTGRVVGAVRPTQSGPHAVVVPAADTAAARVFVASLPPTTTFVAAIFGGVLGIFAAVVLGIMGLGMVIGGIVWRVVRRSPPPDQVQVQVAPPLH